MKMTDAQTKGLKFFAAKLIADKAERKAASRFLLYPDPRTIESLCNKGLIQVVGHNYGALFGITEAGRAALAQ